jgi:hypothetical protein
MKIVLLIAAGALLFARVAMAATHTWTGAVSSSWSNNGNWSGGTPAGDPAADLVFPSGVSQLVSTDDIPGVTFVNSIQLSGSGYTINEMPGSSIALAGNISVTGASNVIALPIALFSGVDHGVFKPSGSCCANSDLTISGVISGPPSEKLVFSSFGGLASNGVLVVTLTGNNTYFGETSIQAGFLGFATLFVMGNQPNSPVTGSPTAAAPLRGTGTVGPLTPGYVAPGTANATGVLHSVGNGQLAQSSTLKVRLNGITAGSQYDQLDVTGAMQLSGGGLQVQLGYTPAVGDSFTILQASGGITGTFAFSEGQIFSANCLNFQIHYTPTAVVLTRVAGGGPPLTGVTIATDGSRTTCPDGTASTATVTDAGGCENTHQWGFRTVSGGAITPIPNATGPAYTIRGSDFLGEGTFYLVETTTPGPGSGSPITSNELTITVAPAPTAVASGSATVCSGGGTILSGSGAATCGWSPSTGLSDASSCTPLASPSMTTTYSLTVMGVTGCSSVNTAEVTVTVDPTCTGNIGPLSFYTLEPCRLADTREFIGSYGGPSFSANEDREFPLSGQCGIPEGARAVALNVTVTNPTSGGHLTLHPGGTPVPAASTINFRTHQTRANNTTARLSANAVLAVFAGLPSGTVDVILDVVGYFQ